MKFIFKVNTFGVKVVEIFSPDSLATMGTSVGTVPFLHRPHRRRRLDTIWGQA
jgi:hypothetical protein